MDGDAVKREGAFEQMEFLGSRRWRRAVDLVRIASRTRRRPVRLGAARRRRFPVSATPLILLPLPVSAILFLFLFVVASRRLVSGG